jgi:hypothetical protein
MPEENVRGKYSMNAIKQSEEEEEMTIETKQNNAILSEWDEAYEKGPRRTRKSGERVKKRKKNRRESLCFGKSICFSHHQDECNAGKTGGCNQSMSSMASTDDHGTTNSAEEQISEGLALLQMSPDEFRHEACKVVNDGENTWEFLANLCSINSSGAACTLMGVFHGSPNTFIDLKTSTSEARTNTSQIEWDKISRGEKFATQYDCHLEGWSSDEDSITKAIYQQPAMDQGISLPFILQTLSRLQRNGRENMIKILLPADPYALELVSTSIEVFLDNILFTSPARGHVTTSEEIMERAAIDNWHWEREEYPHAIDVLARMTALDQELKSLLAAFDKAVTSGRDVYSLQLEILRLEKEIDMEESHKDTINALFAPRAAMLCHATAYVSMFGFDVDRFDADEFVLKWEHMEGLESRVTFRTCASSNFKIHPYCATWLKASTEVLRLHAASTNLIETTLKKEPGSLELCFSLLRMSKSFATLDQIFLAETKAENTGGMSVSADAFTQGTRPYV